MKLGKIFSIATFGLAIIQILMGANASADNMPYTREQSRVRPIGDNKVPLSESVDSDGLHHFFINPNLLKHFRCHTQTIHSLASYGLPDDVTILYMDLVNDLPSQIVEYFGMEWPGDGRQRCINEMWRLRELFDTAARQEHGKIGISFGYRVGQDLDLYSVIH